MIHFKIRIIALLFVLTASVLQAQETLWSEAVKESAKLQFSANGTGLAVNTNTIIQEIADDMIRPPEMISIDILATMNVKVRKGNGGNPILAVSFAQIDFSGNTHYRSFSLADAFKPDKVSFTCRIEKKIDPVTGILIEAANLPWSNFDNRFLVRPLPHFSADSDTVAFENFQMFFSDAAMNPFHERVSLINDYYAAVAIMDTLQQGIRQIDFSLTGNYPKYFIFIEEMNKILSIIKEKDLTVKLNLASYDPRSFQEKYVRMNRSAEEVTNTFRERIKATSIIVPFDSTHAMIHDFLSGMIRYIRWSMLVSERNSRIYYQYLRDYFSMNAFGKDGPMIRDLVTRVYPKENAAAVLTRISLEIKKGYNEMADELIRDHQFAESVELLKNARNFQKINPYLKENEGDKKITTKAANGIYDSFLGVAESAIQNRKFEMAQLYLQKAQLYRKDHAPFVTSDSLYNKIILDLYEGRSAPCDSLYIHGKYTEAYDCYRGFKLGFDSVTLVMTHPDMEKRIAYCMKHLDPDLIAKPGKADDPPARENVEEKGAQKGKTGQVQHRKKHRKRSRPEAAPVAEKFHLLAGSKQENKQETKQENRQTKKHPVSDPLNDTLTENPFPHFLANLLSSNVDRIWTNHLDLANQLVDSVSNVQRTHGFGSSRELSDAIAVYQRKIRVRKCWTEKENVEIFLLRAGREREKKNFIKAESLSDSALICIRKNSECEISPAGIEDSVKVYAEAAEYQKKLHEIERFSVPHKEKELVKALWTAEQYFITHHIDRFGLTNLSSYDVIRERSSQVLTFQAFLFFRQNQHLQESFRYLKLLRLQDYPRDKARDYMQWLGKKYAEKDFREHPSDDPSARVLDYTHGDKWLKYFADSYKHDWRSHKKARKR